MNRLLKLIVIITYIFSNSSLIAQSNITKFESDASETTGITIFNTEESFLSIVYIKDPNSDIFDSYLYKLDNLGDTLLHKQYHKQDTIINLLEITLFSNSPLEYILYAEGYAYGDDHKETFSIFYKIDENLNVLWEKVYSLRPEGVLSSSSLYPQLLIETDLDIILATNISSTDNLIFFRLSSEGDSLSYKHYVSDSAGSAITDLIYDKDSVNYLAITYDAHPNYNFRRAQIITIDTNFCQIEVDYFPNFFYDGISVKLLPSGNMVSGGHYFRSTLSEFSSCMAGYKLNYDYDSISSCFIGDMAFDIRKDAGLNSLDFSDPNSIFIAGTFDFSISSWPTQPSWIILGKLDSTMNLINEKYIGGDAYYSCRSVSASKDGGVLIGTNRYDYVTQDYEKDIYYFRIDSLEMTVGINSGNHNLLKNAITYPNPCSDKFFLRTSLNESILRLYDINGSMKYEKRIKKNKSQHPVDKLPVGMYLW